MRILLLALAPAALLGCTAAGTAGPDAGPDADAACQARGYAPGTEEYRVCMDARGAAVATGPGSPYAADRRMED